MNKWRKSLNDRTAKSIIRNDYRKNILNRARKFLNLIGYAGISNEKIKEFDKIKSDLGGTINFDLERK